MVRWRTELPGLFVVLFVYLVQFLCEAVIAAPIPLMILWLTKKKRAAKAAFIVCLLLALTASMLIARRPYFRCPEKYRPYVPRYYSEAVLYRLRAGVTYSCVVIEVNKQHMCEECIKVKLNMPKIE